MQNFLYLTLRAIVIKIKVVAMEMCVPQKIIDKFLVYKTQWQWSYLYAKSSLYSYCVGVFVWLTNFRIYKNRSDMKTWMKRIILSLFVQWDGWVSEKNCRKN